MSNKAFDREIWNIREKPLSTDNNQALSNSDYTTREMLRRSQAYRTYFDSADGQEPFGFQGQSFMVVAGVGMQVMLVAGIGWQDGSSDEVTDIDSIGSLNDLSPMKPFVLTTNQTINVPAADPSDPRIDIVEVHYDRFTTDPSSRLQLNTGTGQFDPNSLEKTLSAVLDGNTSINGSAKINYKTGTPNSSPVVPSTSAGYVKIAEVIVPASAGAIVNRYILDLRRVIDIGGTDNIVGIRCSVDVTTSTWILATTVLDPVFIAPPGVQVGVFTRKYTSGGFNGLNSIGFLANGAALPAFGRSGVSHLPFGPIRVDVYHHNQITTVAAAQQPLIWSPYFQSQSNTLDLTTPAIVSNYPSSFQFTGTNYYSGTGDPGQYMQVEGFPMRFQSSSQLYSQTMTGISQIEVSLLAIFPTV